MKRVWLAGALALAAALALPRPEVSCETFPLVERDFGAHPDGRIDALTLATLNMAEETDLETVVRDLSGPENMREADVLLLQEVVHSAIDDDSFPVSLARRLGYCLVFAPADRLGPETTRGLAILSRWPLRDAELLPLERHQLGFKNRCRIGLGATIGRQAAPLRVFNVHFDSRINTEDRLRQLRPVLDAAASFDGPKIIGGDFNTANFFWIRHLLPLPYLQFQGRAVQEAFERRGYATPFTDTGSTFSYLPLKLDWIFMKEFEIVDAGVESIRFSDHHGLWARVRPRRAE